MSKHTVSTSHPAGKAALAFALVALTRIGFLILSFVFAMLGYFLVEDKHTYVGFAFVGIVVFNFLISVIMRKPIHKRSEALKNEMKKLEKEREQ